MVTYLLYLLLQAEFLRRMFEGKKLNDAVAILTQYLYCICLEIHCFVEIDHEIFSSVILSLPLIQEEQLSISGKRLRTVLVNCLEDLVCPIKVWLCKLTVLDMTPFG